MIKPIKLTGNYEGDYATEYLVNFSINVRVCHQFSSLSLNSGKYEAYLSKFYTFLPDFDYFREDLERNGINYLLGEENSPSNHKPRYRVRIYDLNFIRKLFSSVNLNQLDERKVKKIDFMKRVWKRNFQNHLYS